MSSYLLSSWLFRLEENAEGLQGVHPVQIEEKTLFRSVMRKFQKTQPAASQKEAENTDKPKIDQKYQIDGAQSVGSVPVPGSISSVRCGGMTFGAQAEEISTKESSSTSERRVTFNISCDSLESANHGVCVGLAPSGVKVDTPMVWDEPNAIMISCASTGATLWSDHMGEYGTKISEKCLFPGNISRGSGARYEGKVQVSWNVEIGSVRFDVFSDKKDGDSSSSSSSSSLEASAVRDYLSNKSQHSAENSNEALKSLLPTIAFSTVVNEDFVSIS